MYRLIKDFYSVLGQSKFSLFKIIFLNFLFSLIELLSLALLAPIIFIFKDIEFPDHYTYTNNDLDQIFEQAKDIGCEIITTEKDYLRLDKNKIDQIKYIKSELNIINEEKLIDIIMKNYETN